MLVSAKHAIGHHPANGQVWQQSQGHCPERCWGTPRSTSRLPSVALETGAEVDKPIAELCNIAYAAWQPLHGAVPASPNPEDRT